MSSISRISGLYVDHYELTMAQGYFLSNRKNDVASFDYFFRKNPFQGGFTIFAGLTDLLEALVYFRFSSEECNYLLSRGFNKKFVEFLKGFRFRGHIYSVQEGEIVFPDEPVLRTEGRLIEVQLIESLLLNILNFQSLIATKAARIRLVAGNKILLEFGLRRAQGQGAIHASRAAIIGGFDSSSNTYSAFKFGFTSSGTMAHSWIQSYDNEVSAFREFVEIYPESAILLVDTYDTLQRGIPNAIKVAHELRKKGGKLLGIRLDSGDLAYLSKAARKMLDAAQLHHVKIFVSNQLNEYVIRSLMEQNAPIDAFGVGTELITGANDGSLDGVYKLTFINGRPTMKFSENKAKMTLPGKKNICRYSEKESDSFLADGIDLVDSDPPETIYHPWDPDKNLDVGDLKYENLTGQVMKNGKILNDIASIEQVVKYSGNRLKQLSDEYKRFDNPHIFKTGISMDLMNLRNNLKNEL